MTTLLRLPTRCESDIAIIAWKITLNYANSPFKLKKIPLTTSSRASLKAQLVPENGVLCDFVQIAWTIPGKGFLIGVILCPITLLLDRNHYLKLCKEFGAVTLNGNSFAFVQKTIFFISFNYWKISFIYKSRPT